MNGILLFDKPLGLSSNQAVQRVRHLLGVDKAGHTGALDPLATGMLPICLGEATKIAGLLLGERKCYRATIALGRTTTTGDVEGETVEESAVPVLNDELIQPSLARFVGKQLQKPPAYSALKKNGVPLYKLARRGIAVDPPPRPIEIFSLRALAHTERSIDIEVVCGSGTYIRSLAVDIGAALGCAAHLSALRRLWVEPFNESQMITLDELLADAVAVAARLRPIEEGIAGLARFDLDAEQSLHIRQGKTVYIGGSEVLGLCRLHDAYGTLLALAERLGDGRVKSRRVFVFDRDGSSESPQSSREFGE